MTRALLILLALGCYRSHSIATEDAGSDVGEMDVRDVGLDVRDVGFDVRDVGFDVRPDLPDAPDMDRCPSDPVSTRVCSHHLRSAPLEIEASDTYSIQRSTDGWKARLVSAPDRGDPGFVRIVTIGQRFEIASDNHVMDLPLVIDGVAYHSGGGHAYMASCDRWLMGLSELGDLDNSLLVVHDSHGVQMAEPVRVPGWTRFMGVDADYFVTLAVEGGCPSRVRRMRVSVDMEIEDLGTIELPGGSSPSLALPFGVLRSTRGW